jgi:hypothetical protein
LALAVVVGALSWSTARGQAIKANYAKHVEVEYPPPSVRSSHTPGVQTPAALRDVDAIMESVLADFHVLGATVAIAKDGKLVLSQGYGWANLLDLGWHQFDQGGGTGVISRFKIVGSTPRKWGVKLALPSGRTVYLFNAHFRYFPYQPYQLLRIPYNEQPFLRTAAEAIQAAHEARGRAVSRMLAEVREVVAEQVPVFITGDFNEPSHQDWTARATETRMCPLPVEWPATKAVVAAGVVDAYRQVYRDEVAHRGLTWTPTTRCRPLRLSSSGKGRMETAVRRSVA